MLTPKLRVEIITLRTLRFSELRTVSIQAEFLSLAEAAFDGQRAGLRRRERRTSNGYRTGFLPSLNRSRQPLRRKHPGVSEDRNEEIAITLNARRISDAVT
jgi:hypothetical protein